MSLTSELSSSRSWVNQYFKSRFGKVTGFVNEVGPMIKGFKTKVPTDLRGFAPRRIGTAVDYRIRLQLGLQIQTSVSEIGILWMENQAIALPPEDMFDWGTAVRQHLKEIDGIEDRRSMIEEEQAQTAILLAHLDEGFRSGGLWQEDMIEIVKERTGYDSWPWEEILKVARPEETSEVMQMARLAKEAFGKDGDEIVVLGPTFDGSEYVGGADADFIKGGCLYDIKTTMDPRRDLPSTVRQLIGYALLDWEDQYQLQKAGIYFSRQREQTDWNLEELIARTTSDGQSDLVKIRNEFKDLAIWESGREDTI